MKISPHDEHMIEHLPESPGEESEENAQITQETDVLGNELPAEQEGEGNPINHQNIEDNTETISPDMSERQVVTSADDHATSLELQISDEVTEVHPEEEVASGHVESESVSFEAEAATELQVSEEMKDSSSAEVEPQVVVSSPEHSEVEMLMMDESELEEMEKRDEEVHVEDFSGLDKEQLVKLAEQLNRDQDAGSAFRIAQKIRPLFVALYDHDKADALEKYLADGGEAETFEYKHASLETRFEQALKGIFEKRKLNQDYQNKERAKNLESKLTLLEQLRQLVADHEHTPGYEKFKEIKEDWKKIGPVGAEHAQNLNASYYSLIEQFYSLSEIYHSLRDFDRKKNLELKLDLVSKIEKLAEEPMISKAMKDLMNYQDEYRSLGPVPKDKLDELRLRLKNAVDAIYERRRAFNEERKTLMAEEIKGKEELLAKISPFENFVTESIKDWQAKTKEILELQEEWRKSPGRFREKTTELNKQFWSVFKKFMNTKNDFYRQLDKTRKELLSRKQAIVDEVNSLKDGDDWDGIANRLKALQQAWKEVPPTFGKEGQKIYEEFKAGVDHFFTRLRDRRSGEDQAQQENLNRKEAICAEIELLASKGEGDRATLDELREKFRSAGHVPMKSIQKINGRFSKALIEMVDKSSVIPQNEKERIKISILSSRSTYSTEGVKTLRNQEGYIQKRLQQLRKDVGTLEDNVSMFRMSKNAMSLIEDVQKRINLSRLEIKELESQLKQIREGDTSEK